MHSNELLAKWPNHPILSVSNYAEMQQKPYLYSSHYNHLRCKLNSIPVIAFNVSTNNYFHKLYVYSLNLIEYCLCP